MHNFCYASERFSRVAEANFTSSSSSNKISLIVLLLPDFTAFNKYANLGYAFLNDSARDKSSRGSDWNPLKSIREFSLRAEFKQTSDEVISARRRENGNDSMTNGSWITHSLNLLRRRSNDEAQMFIQCCVCIFNSQSAFKQWLCAVGSTSVNNENARFYATSTLHKKPWLSCRLLFPILHDSVLLSFQKIGLNVSSRAGAKR